MTRKTQQRRAARERPADVPIRAVAYLRLSKAKTGDTRATAERSTEVGLETQRVGCERHVAALGGTIVATEHDVAAGDRLDNRTGLFRAIEAIESGVANTLIVYSLERLSRDAMQQSAIVQALRRAGGHLLSATETVEDGPLGDLMRAVYAFGGAYELAKTRERVNRALDAKFRLSKRYRPAGRPPYGYRRIGSGEAARYEIDPAESLIVRRIFAERAAGASVRAIITGLRADGVPTPAGRGQWGTHSVMSILGRPVYWTGQHEVWRTKTVRDADGVPFLEPRPAEERYSVPFPAFIDPEMAERAMQVAKRNVWQSNRHDRTEEFGIGRHGFFRCSGCGRALTLAKPKVGRPKYACTSHAHLTRPCPAPTSISVDLIDTAIWGWVKMILAHPERAGSFRVVRRVPDADPAAVAALVEAERRLADLEARTATLSGNLSLLAGAAAQIVADQLNTLAEELQQARATRDQLALEAEVAELLAGPEADIVDPTDVVGRAVLHAVDACATRTPCQTPLN